MSPKEAEDMVNAYTLKLGELQIKIGKAEKHIEQLMKLIAIIEDTPEDYKVTLAVNLELPNDSLARIISEPELIGFVEAVVSSEVRKKMEILIRNERVLRHAETRKETP
jgi:hypothetical protein